VGQIQSRTLAMPSVSGATAGVKSPTLKFMQRAWEQDHGGEGEDFHDLVGVVSAAGDQDVEGADDRLAGVAGFLQSGLIAREERLEPFARPLVA
jgi:hypothetical protein